MPAPRFDPRRCALALAIALAAALPAQTRAVVALLHDSGGNAVADAAVAFIPDAEPDVPALREFATPSAPVSAHSDTHGFVRIASERPGLLLATTSDGLGAVAARCWPERAVRLALAPLAAVRLLSGAPFTLWPALVLADGSRRHLPPLTGTEARLPAGRYETWSMAADGFCWRELTLRSGERAILAPAGEPQSFAVPDAIVSPAGFPQIDLGRGTGRCELLGAARHATLFVRGADGSARRTGLRAPDADVDAAATATIAVAGADAAEAWLVERTTRMAVRVFARALVHQGTAALPRPRTAGDFWVLVTAPDRAAAALPLPAPDVVAHANMTPGRTVRCRVTDADGQPLAAIAVEFEAGDGGPATAIAYTDELGEARLGPIAGPGSVCIDDERFCSVAQPLAANDARPVTLELAPGLGIRGTVALADGSPAANVAVTLRDSLGRLRPIERTAVTAADGSFAFTGLPPCDSLVLFANPRYAGHTFSARERVASGDADVRLVLRDEDPQILPPERGK